MEDLNEKEKGQKPFERSFRIDNTQGGIELQNRTNSTKRGRGLWFLATILVVWLTARILQTHYNKQPWLEQYVNLGNAIYSTCTDSTNDRHHHHGRCSKRVLNGKVAEDIFTYAIYLNDLVTVLSLTLGFAEKYLTTTLQLQSLVYMQRNLTWPAQTGISRLR